MGRYAPGRFAGFNTAPPLKEGKERTQTV